MPRPANVKQHRRQIAISEREKQRRERETDIERRDDGEKIESKCVGFFYCEI